MPLKYCSNNPLISPEDIPVRDKSFRVIGAFNPGVTEFEGRTLLLVRVAESYINSDDTVVKIPVIDNGAINFMSINRNDSRFDFSDKRVVLCGKSKLLTSVSKLIVAVSDDGVNFTLHSDRGIFPESEYERFGIEDPRITKIDDTYYINYSAVSEKGVCTAMQSTRDFVSFKKHGIILCPDNKDSAIFPERINGKYYMLHRPSCSEFAAPEMWIAESENLTHWGNHRLLMNVRSGMWDESRIGASSVPIKTDKGWLVIYHGADNNNRYCMGAVLLDLDNPQRVIARSHKPFMEPVNPYETNGFFSNVVFSCGCVRSGDTLKIYYGAADSCICRADIEISEIISAILQ